MIPAENVEMLLQLHTVHLLVIVCSPVAIAVCELTAGGNWWLRLSVLLLQHKISRLALPPSFLNYCSFPREVNSEGGFIVIGQIQPLVRLILRATLNSEWPENDRQFWWSFLTHFSLIKMHLSSKMPSHFFREKCIWPLKWPTLK